MPALRWTRRFGSAQPDHGRAVLRLGLRAADERVPRELLADGRAHRAGAAAVDDAHLRQARRAPRRRRTRAPPRGPPGRACRARRARRTRRRARPRARARPARPPPPARARGATGAAAPAGSRHAMPPGAEHLRLVAVDRRDRAAHAERPAPRPGRRPRAAPSSAAARERAERPLGARAASAAAPRRRSRSRLRDGRLRGAARARARAGARRGSRSRSAVELGARLGEVALGLLRARASRSARPTRAPLDLAPRARASRARRARERRPRSLRSAAARSAAAALLGRLGLGEQLGRPQPLRRRCGRARRRRRRAVEPEPLGDLQRVRRARPAERDPVERLVRLGIEAGRGVRDAVGRARPLLQLGVVRRHDRQPRLRGEPREQRLRERRALDRVGARRRARRAARASARSRARGSRRGCAGAPEKVDRLISIDCSSPMSASTSSKTGSAASRAGGRSPDWCSSAARPSVFSATVLPPVFGPLIDERAQRRRGRGRSARPSRGRAADAAPPSRRTSSPTRDRRAAPAAARARRTRARGRSPPSPRRALASASARAPTQRGQLAQDPLDLLALGARGLGEAVVQLDDRERLDEQRLPRARGVVDDARHAAARRRPCTASTGRPAALGDELLLQVLGSSASAPPGELGRDALAAAAQLAAQPPQLRRGVVAQVGAVLLDRALDRRRAATRAPGRSAAAEESRRASPGVRRAASATATATRHGAQIRRPQRAAARGELRRVAHVGDPRERRLGCRRRAARPPRPSAPAGAPPRSRPRKAPAPPPAAHRARSRSRRRRARRAPGTRGPRARGRPRAQGTT